MIVHQVKQGTPDWHQLRLGIPTASEFSRIVTPTGELSKSRHKLMAELLAERYMGKPLDKFTSAAMERGAGLEEEAVAFYECKRRMDSVKVGFVTNDARTIGASPDRFLGEEETLEVKCPEPHTHMAYLLASVDAVKAKTVAQEYKPQVQGQLWITGRKRKRCVTLSYCPGFPSAIVEAERDDKYIDILSTEIELFSRDLERQWAQLVERYGLPSKAKAPAVDSAFGITDEDVAVLMASYQKRGAL